MTARLTRGNREYEVSSGRTAWEADAELAIPVESVIPSHRGQTIGGEAIIEEGETIRLVLGIAGD